MMLNLKHYIDPMFHIMNFFFVVLLIEITFFNPESNLRNLKCVQIDMGSDFFGVLFIPSVALYTIFQAYQG